MLICSVGLVLMKAGCVIFRDNTVCTITTINTRNQQAGENIDAYVIDLKNKASLCEFSTLKDSLIRDRIVCIIRSDEVRARLLRDPDLTLVKAIDACLAAETSQTQLKVWLRKSQLISSKREEILSLDRILLRMEQHNSFINSSHARIRHIHASVKDVDILMKKRNVLLLERNVETVQSWITLQKCVKDRKYMR